MGFLKSLGFAVVKAIAEVPAGVTPDSFFSPTGSEDGEWFEGEENKNLSLLQDSLKKGLISKKEYKKLEAELMQRECDGMVSRFNNAYCYEEHPAHIDTGGFLDGWVNVGDGPQSNGRDRGMWK